MNAPISFPTIPPNLRIPLFALEFANSGQPGQQTQTSLLIGNTLTAQPAVPVLVASIAAGVSLFGAGSVLAQMVERVLTADPFAELYCLPLADNGSGVKASGSISFTGTASAAGTLALYIGGRSIPVGVTSGMTAAQLATATAAAINAYLDANGVAAPVVAAVDGTHAYQVDLTAQNAGTLGNSIDVRLNYYGAQNGEATPAGISVTIAAMATGATNPVTTGIAAILGSANYDFIAIAWSDTTTLTNMTAMNSNATGRWSWSDPAYGHVWAAKQDADATGSTNIAFGQTLNDPHLTVVSYEPLPGTQWEVAAAYMGGCAASLRADPARPLQTLAVPGILPPPSTGRYTKPVQQNLLTSGMALMQYNADGSCAVRRAVTTYQKNQWGTPDTSYLDTETLYTLMAVVRTLKNDVLTVFPRAKLVDDGTNFGAGNSFTNGQADQPITTPNGVKSMIISSYDAMGVNGSGPVLTQDTATFAQGLIVQRNGSDPTRLDVLFDPILASGLRILAVLTQFTLQAPAQ